MATVFVMTFLAELGDKTQLTTVAFAGSEASKWSVFAGAAMALVVASAMATLVGAVMANYISPKHLDLVAGTLFVSFGVYYLVR